MSISLGEVYRDNKHRYIKIAYRICKNIDDAEDAVQNAALKALMFVSADKTYQNSMPKIVKHCAIDILNGRPNKASCPDPLKKAVDCELIDFYDEPPEPEIIESLLRRVKKNKTYLTFRYVDGFSRTDACIITDISYQKARKIEENFIRWLNEIHKVKRDINF